MKNMSHPLLIRRLTVQDEDCFFKATKSWEASTSFHWATPNEREPFGDFVLRLSLNEKGEQLEPGFVPCTSLYGFFNDEIVGRISLRHQLTEHLLKVGGHIGYGVLPRFRRRGFATTFLNFALQESRRLHLPKVLVTCDDDNIGSIKVIEKNNGVLENKLETEAGKPLKRRYWISLE